MANARRRRRGVGAGRAGSRHHHPGWWGEPGGARGCVQRSKVSMTIIRPPQHGQSGLGSGGSTGSGLSVVSGTASSSRARATLALRPALASSP